VRRTLFPTNPSDVVALTCRDTNRALVWRSFRSFLKSRNRGSGDARDGRWHVLMGRADRAWIRPIGADCGALVFVSGCTEHCAPVLS